MKKIISLCSLMVSLFLISGCAKNMRYDYTAFNESKPQSILVMMPTNESIEIQAGYGVLSQINYPLAEAGYYVFPVMLVNEMFKQNGLTIANDIHAINTQKLHQVFGADAGLYLNITQYGTSYRILDSDTRVTLEAKLIDLRTGKLLWQGTSSASSNEQQNDFSSLLTAVITQVIDTVSDRSFNIANIATQRLLTPNPTKKNGILHGPRFPGYQQATQ